MERYSDNIKVFQHISKFEKDLSGLVNSISRFQPSSEHATQLVLDTDRLQGELDQLQHVHDMRVNQMLNQTNQDKSLDDSLRTILVELSECRKSLVSLPRLSDAEQQREPQQRPSQEETIQATEQLLDYAMKLSKFSKIPRTVEGFLHPNNCIWPADGNMRRGMLAMASLLGDKLIKLDGDDDLEETGATDKTAEVAAAVADDDSDMDEIMPYNDSYNDTKKQKKTAESVVAGLDLFDSDDE